MLSRVKDAWRLMKGRRVAKVNKLILDGKEYALSDDLVEKLKESVAAQGWAKKTGNPLARCESCGVYYYINQCGQIVFLREEGDALDRELYEIANYCRDEAMMKQRALHETLNRLLWRYSETHGGDLPFESTENKHYFIYHGLVHDVETAYSIGMKLQGVVYFKDEETARSAIEEVVKPFLAEHPEFVW